MKRLGRVLSDVSGSAERCALTWIGYVERMDDEMTTKRASDSGVEARRGRGNPIRV